MGIFCCCMMSSSCVRTSLAFFRPAFCSDAVSAHANRPMVGDVKDNFMLLY